jgi:protein-S-isoprenylcysteine O-methyltransferase Ste14
LKPDQIIIIAAFAVMFVQMIGFGLFLRINKLNIGGAAPVHPALFKSAKAAMFLSWLALFIQATGTVNLSIFNRHHAATLLAVALWVPGTALQLWAYFELGKNLKFGLPDSAAEAAATFKTTGLYRFSRNPMYVGFYLMLLSACLYVLHPVVWLFSVFAVWVHHQIVLQEELFLKNRFGTKWEMYAGKVKRYV